MMQKRRLIGSSKQAISYAIGVMGAAQAGEAIGKTAGLVYTASDPDSDYRLPYDYAVDIDLAYRNAGHPGVPPMLAHHMAALGHTDAEPAGNFKDANSELLDMFPALADLQEIIRRNKADHHWSESEDFDARKARAEVCRQMDEAIAASKLECAGPRVVVAAE